MKLFGKKINWKLFAALFVMGLCPTVWTTVRTFIIGTLPGEWSYSIAGQLSWVNLIYEIINEAIILPLYFFMEKASDDKAAFINRLKTGLLVSFGIYLVPAVLIFLFAEPMLGLMAADSSIIAESAVYIRIESIADIFGIMFSYACVALVSLGKSGPVYALTGIRLAFGLLCDTFMASELPISLKLGVNGIGCSNIVTNAVLFIAAVLILAKLGFNILKRERLSFAWMADFAKIGGVSGLESLVRNIAYMLMVSRMVNMVGEQGTYWVANNFIWGWLLLPVTALGELIKQETAADRNAVKTHLPSYFFVTGIICAVWVVTVPAYKPFMQYVLGYSDVDKLFGLVMVLLGFYILYAIQNIFDSIFYGRGKTGYMLFEAVVTNTLYYGLFFVLYLTGVWKPTLIGIALMFGCGNAFDSVVSGLAFMHFMKNEPID